VLIGGHHNSKKVNLDIDDDDRGRLLTIRLVLKVSVNRWAPQLKKVNLGTDDDDRGRLLAICLVI
jgi:hypothetical protein